MCATILYRKWIRGRLYPKAARTGGGWQTGQYYYMMGSSTGWYAAAEFGPGWTYGSTTAPWAAPSGDDWAELAVAYSLP